MTKDEILHFIKQLACSQGFYGRMLECIYQDPTMLDYLEEQNFSGPVEMIMFIEG